MLKYSIGTVLLLSLAAPAFSDSIDLTILSAANQESDPNVASAAHCDLTVSATNNMNVPVDFRADLALEIKSGSLSSYTFGILNEDFVTAFSTLDANETLTEELTFGGLDCDDIEKISALASCSEQDTGADCAALVTVPEDSAVAISLPTDEVIVGPLHGKWGGFAPDGTQYLTVDIVDDLSGEFTASFATEDAFCAMARAESGCPEGQLDKGVGRISGDQDRLFMVLNMTDNPNKDQVNFTMHSNEATGVLMHTSKIVTQNVEVRRVD